MYVSVSNSFIVFRPFRECPLHCADGDLGVGDDSGLPGLVLLVDC